MPTDTSPARKTVDMPDRPRTYRAPDELYRAAQDRAWERREEDGLSGPIRLALRAYVEDPEAFTAACRQILGES